MGNNEISNEQWNFFKLKLGVSKLLECRILHQIPQSGVIPIVPLLYKTGKIGVGQSGFFVIRGHSN